MSLASPPVKARSHYRDVNVSKPQRVLNFEEPPLIFGKAKNYKVEGGDELGRGAYATVFPCSHVPTGSRMAVKVFAKTAKSDQKMWDRVQREVHMLKQVQGGPNIIALNDVLKDGDSRSVTFSLVFEHVHAAQFTPATGFEGIPMSQRKRFLYKVLQALDYCHSQGIIHRDVKMRNILFAPATDTVKLIDFGFGIYYIPDEPKTTFFGTTHWKAPEVLLRYPFYDYAVDMWAFGVLCHYVYYTGYIWTPNRDPQAQMQQICKTLGFRGFSAYLTKFSLKTLFNISKENTRVDLAARAKEKKVSVPSEAMDLIDRLLVFDHSDRLTATECLAHPFFASVRSSSSASASAGTSSGTGESTTSASSAASSSEATTESDSDTAASSRSTEASSTEGGTTSASGAGTSSS